MHNIENMSEFRHKIKITVRFSDLDAMQHVNNAAYLSYLEEARIAYFNHILERSERSLDFGAVIGRIEIDYVHPIVLGDKVEVLTRVTKLGNKSSDMEHIIVIHNNPAPVIAAKAFTKLVSYDYKNQRAVSVPDIVRRNISEFENI